MKRIIFCCALIFFLYTNRQVQAQGFLQKMKDKMNALKNNNNNSQQTNSSTNNSSNNGGPSNKTGQGLSNTPPPDVLTNIDNAAKLSTDSNFSAARYSLQQAIMGVEIQLGKQILQSLPNAVNGLTKDTSKNVVMSTHFGWSNMTIQTVYSDGKEKQMTVMIGNNPLYAGIVNMYANNATYIQANNANNQNIQQVQVKGQRALIEFDKSKGYTLILQLGQSSMIIWECVNFATEDEVLNSANSFDIDGIKKMMGEQ
jgi:hypothetical protein